jgi:hypothetical protein
MWCLAKPIISAESAYSACIARVKSVHLKARLKSASGLIVQAADEFQAAIDNSTVHTLVPSDTVGGTVTKMEMEQVYTLRMARRGSGGYTIYEQIFSSPTQGRCPLCGHRIVTTLDHYLPKALFPALAVVPINLVPACTDCNKIKLQGIAAQENERLLHPYFDNVENDHWLRAEVIQTAPAALTFLVSPAANWSGMTADRVRHHFKSLKLAALYASQAAVELGNIRHYLSDLLLSSGADEVRNHLAAKATSCAAFRTNSWQRATYDALAASAWFYSGGFQSV